MNDQAIDYAERAIAVAEANPDAGYPAIGTLTFHSAMSSRCEMWWSS